MTLDLKISDLLLEVQQELKRLFGRKLSKIFLYGSYARGDYHAESDIDIIALVEDEEPQKFHKQVLRISVDLSIAYDVDLSLIVKSTIDFNSNADVIPLYRNISREGVKIYAA